MRSVLVSPDFHVPYIDEVVWGLFLETLRKLKPDWVVLIGDFLDCYQLSKYEKAASVRAPKFEEEVELANKYLDALGVEAEKVGAKVIFIEGNHEHRWDKILGHWSYAFAAKTMCELLQISSRGWRWVPYNKPYKMGKLLVSHDFEKHGVNASRQVLVKVKRSVAFGHTHKLGITHEAGYNMAPLVAMNTGYGGTLAGIATYRNEACGEADMQQGFGWVDFDSNWEPHCQVFCVKNGRVIVRQKPLELKL